MTTEEHKQELLDVANMSFDAGGMAALISLAETLEQPQFEVPINSKEDAIHILRSFAEQMDPDGKIRARLGE